MGPALAILELSLISRGIRVADAVLKRAVVDLMVSRPVSGGNHLVIFRGSVAEVEESFSAGREAAADALADELLLPQAAESLWPFIPEPRQTERWEGGDPDYDATAVIEVATVCAAVASADAAVKAADVILRDMRLAVGIAGKAFYSFTGQLSDVEASADAAREAAGSRLLNVEVIAAPEESLRGRLLR